MVGSVELELVLDESTEEAALTRMQDRHRAFLKRKASGPTSRAWKPPTRHRVATYMGLCAMHNILAHWIPRGLLWFVATEERFAGPAIRWPRLRATPDTGSDNVCGFGYLTRYLKVNCEIMWDLSHGVHDDLLNGLKASGLFSHLLLALVRLNVVNGPWEEDVWYNKIINQLEDLFNRVPDGTSVPCFMEFVEEMLDEPAGRDLRGHPDAFQQLWARLKTNHPYRRKGAKCQMGRFMNVVRKLTEHLRHFAPRKFCMLFVGLEMGLLAGQKVSQILNDADFAEEAGTLRARAGVQERALRNACSNSYEMALAQMLDDDIHRKDMMVSVASDSVSKWHGEQNSELRATTAAAPFLQRQLAGDFGLHLSRMFRTLSSVPDLVAAGFMIPGSPATDAAQNETYLVAREDEYAQVFVNTLGGIAYNRIRRNAWLHLSWASRSAICLTGDAAAVDREVERMRRDRENDDVFKEMADDHLGLSEINGRSTWLLPSELQIYLVLEQADWEFIQEVLELFRN